MNDRLLLIYCPLLSLILSFSYHSYLYYILYYIPYKEISLLFSEPCQQILSNLVDLTDLLADYLLHLVLWGVPDVARKLLLAVDNL